MIRRKNSNYLGSIPVILDVMSDYKDESVSTIINSKIDDLDMMIDSDIRSNYMLKYKNENHKGQFPNKYCRPRNSYYKELFHKHRSSQEPFTAKNKNSLHSQSMPSIPVATNHELIFTSKIKQPNISHINHMNRNSWRSQRNGLNGLNEFTDNIPIRSEAFRNFHPHKSYLDTSSRFFESYKQANPNFIVKHANIRDVSNDNIGEFINAPQREINARFGNLQNYENRENFNKYENNQAPIGGATVKSYIPGRRCGIIAVDTRFNSKGQKEISLIVVMGRPTLTDDGRMVSIWSFAKGRMTEEETEEKCAIREFEEETGIILSSVQGLPRIELGKNIYFILHTTKEAMVLDQSKIKDTLEVQATAWKTVDEIRNLKANKDVRAIIRYPFRSFHYHKLIFGFDRQNGGRIRDVRDPDILSKDNESRIRHETSSETY